MRLSSGKLLSAAATVACAGALSVAGAFAASTSSPRSCPAGKPQAVHSARDGASAALVPDGPGQVLLCRYAGLGDPHPSALAAQKLVADQSTITSLATEINGLPQLGNVACPADFGTTVVAFFEYSSGPEDPVAVGLSGCQLVTNGQLTRTASSSDLASRLEGLVPVKPVRANATIRGYVRLCGGPAPGRCRIGTIGTCGPGPNCVTTDRVTVTDATGTRVAQAALHKARYSVTVPAGRYTVSLLADGRNVNGRVTAMRTITARAGRTTRVVFQFDVP
jgi:hypothetical protein